MADLTRATVGIVDESTVQESAAPVQDIELTEDETKEQMRVHEEDIIRGLIEAAGYTQDETKRIEIAREKLWDNKKVWEALRNKGLQIMSGLDVIEYCLKAGEKDKVLEAIDALSGYDSNIEEVAKN